MCTDPRLSARGQGRGRTADLPLFRRTLVPTELPARAPETLQQGHPRTSIGAARLRASRSAWQRAAAPKRWSFPSSGLEDDLVLLEPRQPGVPRVLAGRADVDDQKGLQVGAREQVVVDALGVEAAHRTGGQADGADAEQEVADLEGGVEARRGLASGVIGEEVLRPGEVRECAVEMLVEPRVRGQNGDQW